MTIRKRYRCPLATCGKAFSKPSLLRAHSRVHTGDRPFICSFVNCGKSFKWRSGLSYHEQTHLRPNAIPMARSLRTPTTKNSIPSILDTSNVNEVACNPMDMSSLSVESPVFDNLDDGFFLTKSIASEANTTANNISAVNCSLETIDLNICNAVETEETNEIDDLVSIIMDESCKTKVDITAIDEAFFAPWNVSNSSVESYMIPRSPLESHTPNISQSPFSEIKTDWTQPFDYSDFSKL